MTKMSICTKLKCGLLSIVYRLYGSLIYLIKKTKRFLPRRGCVSSTVLIHHMCNILTFDKAVNQETSASNRRYHNITLTCGRVEFGANATPTGGRWSSDNYIIRCHSRFELVGVRGSQFEAGSSSSSRSWGSDAVVRASARQTAWATLQNEKGVLLWYRGSWGQYVAVSSVSSWPLTHNHNQPFCNPFENKGLIGIFF